jgi:hypothetical protein
MKLNSLVARLGDALASLSAAGRAAAAVEIHRRPRARDLERLGISSGDFNRIGY